MLKKSLTSQRKCNVKGQVLPLTLSGVAAAMAILLLLGSIANRVTERSVAADAADAAAYSGATWVAQHLNFLAYTNRAMIANHIGVGHFVAYMSWIRYVDDTADLIQDVLQFVPYVNVAANALEQFADVLRELAEIEGEIFVPAMDGLNLFYAAAQLEAHAILGIPTNAPIPGSGQLGGLPVTPMDILMQDVAESFDSNVRINDFNDINALDAELSLPLQALLGIQNTRIATFVAPIDLVDKRGEFVELTEATYGRDFDSEGLIGQIQDFVRPSGNMSKEWLTDRKTSLPDIPGFSIKKKFKTEHTLTEEIGNWEAEDELTLKPIFSTGGRFTLTSGEASAREFQENYHGIHSGYALTVPFINHQVLPVIAYAAKSDENNTISAISIAHVEHKRPNEGFDPLIALPVPIPFLDDIEANGEHSSLYNPFWRARIVGTHFSDLKKADPLVNLVEGIF